MMPNVSIIMPCHNGALYISDAINSVLEQTYPDWELIVIDDNSTDKSTAIVQDFCRKDKRIKLLYSNNSCGLPAVPRNIGIEKASGRFIAFLDCDDKWLSSKLERQLSCFSNTDCTIVFSYYEKINENNNICSKIIKSPKIVSYEKLLNGDCIGNLTGIYDSEKVGKIFQKEIHAEDSLMWLEILRRGSYAINTNSLEAQYRIHSNSTSSNKLKSALWNWNIYRKELKLSFPSACFHFCMYLAKAVIKYLK